MIIFHVEILDCQVSAEIFVTHGCCHILHASRIDLAKRNDYIKKETAKIVPECGSDTTDSRKVKLNMEFEAEKYCLRKPLKNTTNATKIDRPATKLARKLVSVSVAFNSLDRTIVIKLSTSLES